MWEREWDGDSLQFYAVLTREGTYSALRSSDCSQSPGGVVMCVPTLSECTYELSGQRCWCSHRLLLLCLAVHPPVAVTPQLALFCRGVCQFGPLRVCGVLYRVVVGHRVFAFMCRLRPVRVAACFSALLRPHRGRPGMGRVGALRAVWLLAG